MEIRKPPSSSSVCCDSVALISRAISGKCFCPEIHSASKRARVATQRMNFGSVWMVGSGASDCKRNNRSAMYPVVGMGGARCWVNKGRVGSELPTLGVTGLFPVGHHRHDERSPRST